MCVPDLKNVITWNLRKKLESESNSALEYEIEKQQIILFIKKSKLEKYVKFLEFYR